MSRRAERQMEPFTMQNHDNSLINMNRIQHVDPTQISSKTKHRFDAQCKTLTNLTKKPGMIVFALGALIAHNSSAMVTNFPSDLRDGDLKISHPGIRVWAEKVVHKVNVDSNGVILKGYDPVAYFTQKKASKGVLNTRALIKERPTISVRQRTWLLSKRILQNMFRNTAVFVPMK
jgi:hypothetical protein